MFATRLSPVLAAAASLACAGPSWGHSAAPGRLVSVSVEVEGERAPLYADPKGTGRLYLEAREGARYTLRLDNRTGGRVGVAVTVDGLNVISGERSDGRGRMYILDPWGSTSIRGWRSSLSDVRRFTFVDEKGSYAARSGKANGRMGWIEVSVYREQGGATVCCLERGYPQAGEAKRDRGRDTYGEAQAAPPASGAEPPRATPPPPVDDEPRTESESDGRSRSQAEPSAKDSAGVRGRPVPRLEQPRSFPGTGWGSTASDPAVVVSFDAEATPAEQMTLRYEYASALRALGIRLWPHTASDRLGERERGTMGFAQPPAR